MAYAKRKGEFVGPGALLELLGLIVVWIFPIGTIIGIVLIVMGALMSQKHVCSECYARVDKGAKLCPSCKVPFEREQPGGSGSVDWADVV